jgi:hypothetical protein
LIESLSEFIIGDWGKDTSLAEENEAFCIRGAEFKIFVMVISMRAT